MYFTVVAGAFSNAIRQAKISDGLNGTYGPNIVMMIDIYGSNLETTVLSQTINVLKSLFFGMFPSRADSVIDDRCDYNMLRIA